MLPSLLCEHHPSDGNKPQSSINCLCFSNISIVEQFSGEEIYCLGSSDFGSILSRPFQVLLKSELNFHLFIELLFCVASSNFMREENHYLTWKLSNSMQY
ncbi:unnamed protein product [Trichobilharzia regenti]|nr:unnamed protein product [Trichobilharzia regenti]